MRALKYTHIEFWDQDTKSKNTHPIDKAFALAVISPVDFPEVPFHGINIGISIPHNSQEDADDFYHRFLPRIVHEDILLLLCGELDIKIPLLYADGNAYEPKMGTSCIFCYATPDVLAPGPKPQHPSAVTGEFGTISLQGKFGRYGEPLDPDQIREEVANEG